MKIPELIAWIIVAVVMMWTIGAFATAVWRLL